MAKNIISDIYFSRAFRRMAGKTQLFSNYNNDHFHNRLTHTLEVMHIAERIYNKIGRVGSAYVITAASLAHDLGHTPFGHSGERAINDITYQIDDLDNTINPFLTNKIIFKHNYYSAKVLLGINVNKVKIDRILAAVIGHTDLVYKDIPLSQSDINSTLRFYLKKYRLRDSVIDKINNNNVECQIVAMADEIAQSVSDLHDIALAKVFDITEDDMEKILPVSELNKIEGYPDKFRVKSLMSVYKDHLIDGVSYDKATNTLSMNLKQIKEMEHVSKTCDVLIKKSPQISLFDKEGEHIIKFIFKELYRNPFLLDEKMVNGIYSRILSIASKEIDQNKKFSKSIKSSILKSATLKEKCNHLKKISSTCIKLINKHDATDNDYSHYLRVINSELVYGIAFYIANMTDRFAKEKYSDLKNNRKKHKMIVDKNKDKA